LADAERQAAAARQRMVDGQEKLMLKQETLQRVTRRVEEDLRRSKQESSLSVKNSLKRFKQQMLALDEIVTQLDAEEDAFATLVEQVEDR